MITVQESRTQYNTIIFDTLFRTYVHKIKYKMKYDLPADGRGNFSTLQHLLQLSYSENQEEQQKVLKVFYLYKYFVYYVITNLGCH